jgi:hypothetical protein
MGIHSNFLKATTGTLRKVANDGAKNYEAAADAIDEAEQRDARQQQREHADLAAKFPALEKR